MDNDDSSPPASLRFCWTQGRDLSLESSEPAHPCRAQSVCKWAGIQGSCKHISGILLAVWGTPHLRDARSNHHYISYKKKSVVALVLTLRSGTSWLPEPVHSTWDASACSCLARSMNTLADWLNCFWMVECDQKVQNNILWDILHVGWTRAHFPSSFSFPPLWNIHKRKAPYPITSSTRRGWLCTHIPHSFCTQAPHLKAHTNSASRDALHRHRQSPVLCGLKGWYQSNPIPHEMCHSRP